MKIYHCEDSLEGIFTAIYNTYEDHCIIRDTMVTTIEENLLFSESVEVIPDPEKTNQGDPYAKAQIRGSRL